MSKPEELKVPTKTDIRRYWENWQEEIDSAAEYHAMANHEKDARLASIYRNLAKTEEKHAAFWEDRLVAAGQVKRPRRPSVKSRLLISLAKNLGARSILSAIATKEAAGKDDYLGQVETQGTGMHAQENWHAQVLRAAVRASGPEGMGGAVLSRLESRHGALSGNAVRAAVLGANDGLCSNLSLILGVAGAEVNHHGIVLTGLAGLLAGAFSMALGEWVSVTSSHEFAEHEISTESEELELDPESEGEELQLIYESKGVSPSDARTLVTAAFANKKLALDTLTREELGIDSSELGGSPLEAAVTSLLLFSVGAALPLIPFALLDGQRAIIGSLIAGGASLFLIGALISLLTGRPVVRAGLRQLLLGMLAAGLTFGIGRMIGAAVH